MADKKISQLTGASTPLAGTEVLPIVQGGSTVKVSIDNVTKGRTVNATTFDTDVAAAAVTLTGTTLSADGTDANIDISVTPKGTGSVNITKANIDGGTVDGTVIGGSSAAAGTFTATTANSFALSTTQSVITGGMWYQTSGGKLVFTPPSTGGFKWNNYTNTVEIASLDNAGKLTVADNLVVGTAAKGIDFSANSHAAGMTSELLNWYEEGTWTPVVKDAAAGNAATAASSSGYYTRVGRLVHFTIRLINIDTTGLTAGNQIHITGLPFAVSGTTGSSAFLAEAVSISSTAGSLYAHVDGGTTYFVMFNGTTTGQSNAIVSQITSGSGQLFINGTYVTA